MSTHRAQTIAGTNRGSFAPELRAEAGISLFDAPTFRDSEPRPGMFVRETIVDGESAGSITYRVWGANDDGYADYEDTVEIEWMTTDQGFRGRGLAASALASLRADHPGKLFVTEKFENPTARRVWESALGEVDGMRGDGTHGCRWCCAELADEDDYDDPDDAPLDASLCGLCDQDQNAHRAGRHRHEAKSSCWMCDPVRPGSRGPS